jgi:hypothetical protein
MSTLQQIKDAIDVAITNQTTLGSIPPTSVGGQMKDVAQFASDNATAQTEGSVDILIDGELTANSQLVSSVCKAIILTYAGNTGNFGFLTAQTTDIIDNTSFKIRSLNADGSPNTADNNFVRWCVIK